MKTLQDWLDFCERLHPVAIDMGLERVREVADPLALRFVCPVITVAGTNGKGSTCAMLEAILLQAGYRTGVYTSPHLVHFEERCRLSGQSASAEALAEAFAAVDAARGEVSLTYFEFSTLAILWLMSRANLDAVILEVGLGGRLDAVNIVDADCAVITSIDLDHMAILGSDRETIGREKAGIMRAGRPVVVSDPVPPQSVVQHAEAIGADLWRFGRDFNFSGDKQQWSWAGRGRRYSGMAYPALRGANQLLNAAGAIAAPYVVRDAIAQGKAVNVGVILPLSGANAQFGINSRNGIELVADEINAAGGIKALGGARINLVVADSTSTPTTAANVAQRLLTQNDVVAILGAFASSLTIAISEVTERRGVPLLTMSFSDQITGRGFENIFQVVAKASVIGKAQFDGTVAIGAAELAP